MPAKLSPEERERRRKERSRRSFSDAAYKHYDPKTEGFGSAEEWKGTVDARFGVETVVEVSADLQVLGLTAPPANRRALTDAYRAQSRTAHPNAPGGSDAAFIALRDAYDRLMAQYKD